MKLFEVMRNLDNYFCYDELDNVDINSIVTKPESVKEGDVFISLKTGDEGKQNVQTAIEAGASVVLTSEYHGFQNEIIVDDIRKSYALVSKGFYNNVSDKLKLIAVTGTNGKTTTTKIIRDMLSGIGKKVGIIGTLGAGDDVLCDTGFTTPDPEILHSIFSKLYKKGCEYVVMEASAHALELKKLEGLKFDYSIFTNLTQDHLDFFGDMGKYFQAKQKLFSPAYSKAGIVFGDDEYGKRIINDAQIPIFAYGQEDNYDGFYKNLNSDFLGSSFEGKLLGDNLKLQTKLTGEYNIQNLLASCLCLRLLGATDEQIEKSVKKIEPPEGRFNTINFCGATIIVDFAHTPDGLQKVLSTARTMTKSRLLCVFGCGGNRDKLKRPIMGRITEDLCDEVYVTSDNPRFEKPLSIIEEILVGMNKKNHQIFEKREDAIAQAICDCREGDCLVIAGKGGEKYQDIGGIKHPYDDFEEIYKNLEKLQNKGRNYGS
jgi:UDP-N-acetylmuramoyl-L-alanyl-D-glutamate--2,6-diaminopimelate ligase